MGFGETLDFALVPAVLGLGAVLWLRSGLLRLSPGTLWRGVRQSLRRDSGSFSTLMASLGATVGTANVAGAAGAVLLGGPGALFWIWICGLGGMAIKYCEAAFAVRGMDGQGQDGPMALMARAFPKGGTALAWLYALGGLLSAFAVGAGWQSAAASEAARLMHVSSLPPLVTGGVFGLLTLPVLLGGGEKLKRISARMVPAMCLLYVLGAGVVILVNFQRLPGVLFQVFACAFQPRAALGGGLGAAAAGMRCGTFSGEAGLGTAVLCYATSGERDPHRAGFCGLTEVLIDTLVVCTLTSLAVLTAAPEGAESGLEAVFEAFRGTMGKLAAPYLTLTVWLFALSSAFTWSWYGLRFGAFLGADRVGLWVVRLAFLGAAILGAFFDTARLNPLVSLSNALLLLPNGATLLRLSILSPEPGSRSGEKSPF